MNSPCTWEQCPPSDMKRRLTMRPIATSSKRLSAGWDTQMTRSTTGCHKSLSNRWATCPPRWAERFNRPWIMEGCPRFTSTHNSELGISINSKTTAEKTWFNTWSVARTRSAFRSRKMKMRKSFWDNSKIKKRSRPTFWRKAIFTCREKDREARATSSSNSLLRSRQVLNR